MSFAVLPPDLHRLILVLVPARPRLFIASIVCRAWRKYVLATFTRIPTGSDPWRETWPHLLDLIALFPRLEELPLVPKVFKRQISFWEAIPPHVPFKRVKIPPDAPMDSVAGFLNSISETLSELSLSQGTYGLLRESGLDIARLTSLTHMNIPHSNTPHDYNAPPPPCLVSLDTTDLNFGNYELFKSATRLTRLGLLSENRGLMSLETMCSVGRLSFPHLVELHTWELLVPTLPFEGRNPLHLQRLYMQSLNMMSVTDEIARTLVSFEQFDGYPKIDPLSSLLPRLTSLRRLAIHREVPELLSLASQLHHLHLWRVTDSPQYAPQLTLVTSLGLGRLTDDSSIARLAEHFTSGLWSLPRLTTLILHCNLPAVAFLTNLFPCWPFTRLVHLTIQLGDVNFYVQREQQQAVIRDLTLDFLRTLERLGVERLTLVGVYDNYPELIAAIRQLQSLETFIKLVALRGCSDKSESNNTHLGCIEDSDDDGDDDD